MQKGFAPLIIVIILTGVIVGALGGVLFLKGEWKSQEDQTVPLPTPLVMTMPSPSSKIGPNSVPEIGDFPIYPQSTFIKKEVVPPCVATVIGNGICNATTYTWETTDDFDSVTKFFNEDPTHSGWICSGGAGSYAGPRDASGVTSCKKGNQTYGLHTNTQGIKTTIKLVIPKSEDTSAKADEKPQVCITVIQFARNPQTNQCEAFSTPCDVPDGWVKVSANECNSQ